MKLNLSCLSVAFLLTFSAVGAQQSQLESAAKRWITQNSNELGLKSHHQTNLTFVRKGNSGETLRFQQMIQGVPVFQSEVVVHFNNKEVVTHTSESLQKEAANISVTPAFSAKEALQKVHTSYGNLGEITFEENKLFVYVTESGETKLVYRVVLESTENPGSWETILDAQTGQVISTKDISLKYKHDHNDPHKDHSGEPSSKAEAATLVTGTGYIFNPDPLTRAGVPYGGQYVDGNDATNASLDAARSLVTIPELELAAGMYKLKGTYAEIRQLEAPATGLFTQASNEFLFNRNEAGFEAVNVYWHIDNSMRYINEVLGIDCIPYQNGGIVFFDPHGWNGQDQSSYNYGGGLRFGEGCVDDGEDADVILHELGHGIHDWITDGNPSANLLGEGIGDYWAQSYGRSLGLLEPSDPSYDYMFKWDGHNPCWPGRDTDYDGIYPGDLTGSGHTDGQILSSSMMRIYDRIGREKSDRSFLEGLAMTNASTNQQNAARAIRQAALDMIGQFGFTCADIIVMTEEFTASGYNMPAYECEDMSVNDLNGKIASVYPNPASDKLNIIMDFKKVETAVVLDMTGRKVMEAQIGSNQSSINVGHLPKGVYVLSIKGTSFTHKFVKQ